MSSKYDAWLEGIGVDVQGTLATIQETEHAPREGCFPPPPRTTAAHERPPLMMEETGKKTAPPQDDFSGTPGYAVVETRGSSRHPLAEDDTSGMPGMSESETEGFSAAGAVYERKTDAGEVKVLGGSVEYSQDGYSVSGVVFEGKHDGESVTVGKYERKEGIFEEDGETKYGKKETFVGAKVETDYAEKYGLPKGVVLKGDVGVGTASDEQWIGEKGMALGKQANAAEASVTFGTTGTGDRDETIRVGVSAGEGAAVRVHWGDSDNDCIPEYGVGGDYEWGSIDIKTEDPLRKALELMPGVGGAAGLVTPFIPGNMTVEAQKAAAEAGAAAGQAYDWAAQEGGQVAENVKKGVVSTAESILDAAAEAARQADAERDRQNERDAELARRLAEQASQTYDTASQAVSDTAQDVSNAASNFLFGDE